MRRCEPTGVATDSAVEYGDACVTCGAFSAHPDDPCGECTARPERRAALRWAVDTMLALGHDDPRVQLAKKKPETEGEEGEWRCDAIRTLCDEGEVIALIECIIMAEWPERPNLQHGLGVYLGSLPTESERMYRRGWATRGYESTSIWPCRDDAKSVPFDDALMPPSPLLLPLSSVPHFLRMLLAILDGPDAAGKLFDWYFHETYIDVEDQSVRGVRHGVGRWDWHLITTNTLITIPIRPVDAVREAVTLANRMKPSPRPCSGCKWVVKEGEDWCRECLAIVWAGALLIKCGHNYRKAIAHVVERAPLPNLDLPLPNPVALVNVLDKLACDPEWLRMSLVRRFGVRGWCGVRSDDLRAADGLVQPNGKSFMVAAELDEQRYTVLEFSAKQAARLLPSLTHTPFFLPDVRERISNTVEIVYRGELG